MSTSALIVVLSFGVLSACEFESSNKLWERNDKLLITLDLIYDNLARPVRNEVCNPHKRSFSIIAQLVLTFVSKSDVTAAKVIKHSKKLLKEPADVIAADVRRNLDILRVIIDEPINDIKRFCKPNTNSTDCGVKLLYHTALQTLNCPFYLNHVKIREDVQNLLLEEDFQHFLEGAMGSTVLGTDESAIDFFIQNVVHKKVLFKNIGKLIKKYKSEVFPCMYTGLYNEWRTIICPDF